MLFPKSRSRSRHPPKPPVEAGIIFIPIVAIPARKCLASVNIAGVAVGTRWWSGRYPGRGGEGQTVLPWTVLSWNT